MKNVVKKLLLFSCFIITFCFIDIVGVKAENENTGYAECWYKINKDYYNDEYDDSPYGELYISLKVSRVSTISNSCIKGDIGRGFTGYCYIKSFEHNGIVSKLHPEPKVYQCPDKLYVGGYYDKKDRLFSTPEYKYTKEGLMNLKISVNEKNGEKENLYWSTASLERNFILPEETEEHNADETGAIIIGDKRDQQKADPMDTSSPREDIQGVINWGNYLSSKEVKYEEDVCLLIGETVQQFLNTLFIIISVIGIILLIVMSAVEFIKVITGSDEDGIKIAFKHTLIRTICIVILLILPGLIGWILDIVNDNFSGKYEIGSNGEPLCEIGK